VSPTGRWLTALPEPWPPQLKAIPRRADTEEMATDPGVITAIETAVAADPGNSALRIHLGRLLLGAGRLPDALAQAEAVLIREPDNIEALGLAAQVGEILHDARAPGWRRLHDSLTGSSEDVGTGQPGQVAGPAARDDSPTAEFPEEAGGGEDPWDRLLTDVLADAGYPDQITLSDVGGLVEVKERLEQSFLGPLRNPELRRAYGAHLRGGLLLWGPPGCGKTFLARAVAGELGARFATVGLHHVLDMWLGNSEKQLHELFEMARRSTPCVLFFDELDAIGHSRMELGRSAARNVVAQLLVELDGVDHSNEGIFVIGATNQPWDVDPALRRPGRFDRTMLILPPDTSARVAILRYHLRDRPLGNVDFEALALGSEGMSGADLRLVCEEAAELGLAEAIASSALQPITTQQLAAAIRSIRSSTSAWFESARNHVRYANASGEYDDLATYLRQRRSR
jgi:AAA+ superfamily predicted ATPase